MGRCFHQRNIVEKCRKLFLPIKGTGGENIRYYEKIINALSEYFNMYNWQKLFMQGGCFWLASILHQGIPNSVYMINRIEEHCALYFEKGLYDVRGRISQKNFSVAGQKEISFMKKNYVPRFNAKDLENYLYSEGLMNKNLLNYRKLEIGNKKI